MTTGKRKRSKYTEEFKREAVALVTEQGYKIAEAVRSLDVGYSEQIRQFTLHSREHTLAPDICGGNTPSTTVTCNPGGTDHELER
jgi:transposase-like protein